MATLTVYPDPGNPGSTSCDGEITYANAATYATAHDATAGTNLDAQGTSILTTQNYKVSANSWYISRCVVNFDTSALTGGATISAATLDMYSTADTGQDTNSVSLSLVLNTIVSNTAYATTDYDLFGTTKQATDITYASITESAYNTLTLNATGLGNISLTGVTHFGLRESDDISNTEPTGGNYHYFSSADVASTTQDPKLTITYTTGAAGTVRDARMLTLLGVG